MEERDMTAVVEALPERDYHATPGLSSTGMKWLLRSPKHYQQQITHRVERAAFDLGHAVHAKVLGVGMDIIVIPDDVLASNGAVSTKEAKAFITDARAHGLVPVKADVLAQVDTIAESVLANPKAASLLTLPGNTEISIFKDDPDTGVPLRGRLDRLAYLNDGRLMNVDLKSTTDVRRYKLIRSIEDYGYDIQSETYKHLLRLAFDKEIAPTHLIFVEVDPPHEVRVVQLAHEDWIYVGQQKMRRAIDIYAQCTATGEWPGDDDTPGSAEAITPRPYYLDNLDEEEMVI
jgi:hypothetical protein